MELARHCFAARDYDLSTTLNSGQAFRWETGSEGWTGVVKGRWVLLQARSEEIWCSTPGPMKNWDWMADYLQVGLDLGPVLESFPDDSPMREALRTCRGLRLLRQDPWECLASFILSSTKQITQIRQVVDSLARCFGKPAPVPQGYPRAYAFPGPEIIAACSESALRACKMGFRAPFLQAVARKVTRGEVDLEAIRNLDIASARQCLMRLPGVGPKIANCVLLFAYGFPTAFPLDVWVLRALRDLYFPGRKVGLNRLIHFSETYFGPNSGYAQQYLFHYIRTKRVKSLQDGAKLEANRKA